MSAAEGVPDVVLRNLFDDDAARLDGANPDNVIVTCGICDQEISGPARGAGSAVMKLGTHRYTKHKIRKGDRPSRPRPGAPSSEELAGEDTTRIGQVVSIVRDMADGAGAGRVDRAPTADELTRGFGRGLSIVTVLGASAMAETDPGIPEGPEGDRDREALIDYLALPLKASQDVMAPIGRMLAPTRVNKKYGRAVVENVDVLASFGELATLGMHWRRYLSMRGQWSAAAGGVSNPPAAVPFPAAAAPAQPAAPMAATSPGPQAGRVLGPEDVARAKRGQ